MRALLAEGERRLLQKAAPRIDVNALLAVARCLDLRVLKSLVKPFHHLLDGLLARLLLGLLGAPFLVDEVPIMASSSSSARRRSSPVHSRDMPPSCRHIAGPAMNI